MTELPRSPFTNSSTFFSPFFLREEGAPCAHPYAFAFLYLVFSLPCLDSNIITIIIFIFSWGCFTKLKTVYVGRDEHCKTPVFGIGGSGVCGCVGSFQLIDIG